MFRELVVDIEMIFEVRVGGCIFKSGAKKRGLLLGEFSLGKPIDSNDLFSPNHTPAIYAM
jgi:hypothetical protein